MGPSLRLLSVCAFLVTLLWAPLNASPAGQDARSANLADPGLEFLHYDSGTLTRYWRGVDAKSRRQRLEHGEPPERFGLLLDAHHLDEALDLLGSTVSASPRQISALLARGSGKWSEFVQDGTRDYRPRLRVVAAAIRGVLAALPREDAARAARQLMDIDAVTGNRDGSDWREAVSRFTKDTPEPTRRCWPKWTPSTRIRSIDALLQFAKTHAGSVAGAKALYLAGFQFTPTRSTTASARGRTRPSVSCGCWT